SVAMAIGDVAGHGLRAASMMGQLRMGLRAYAVEEYSPAQVVNRLQHLAQRLRLPDMVTLIYLVFDPESGVATLANAGHPPPLLIHPNGEASYIEDGSGHPLGISTRPDQVRQTTRRLPVGSTLLLFTDGLVERRGISIHEG